MDAVKVSPEMDELAKLFAANSASKVADFVVDPENVLSEDLLFVVPFLAQMTAVLPFVVVDRVDVNFHLFLTDETLLADRAQIPT